MERISRAVSLFIMVCMPVLVSGAVVPGRPDRVAAADSVSARPDHRVALEARPGYVFHTHDFFKRDNAAGKPVNAVFSAHLKYSFRFSPESGPGRLYPHTWQGAGLSYAEFFRPREIGRPVMLYVFQNSRIASLSPVLSLNYEWDFGASFGWKKYDLQTNPMNMVVGSSVNAYMSVGFSLEWAVSGKLHAVAGVHLTHFSNGNTAYPNAGVNLAEGRIGLSYSFKDEDRECRAGAGADAPEFIRHVSYDLVLYGALRKKGFYLPDGTPYVVQGSFAVGGLNFNPMFNFNKYFKAGVSLDVQYDESANIQSHIANDIIYGTDLKFYRPPLIEQLSAGLSVRAEIVMPVFSINIGIGRNIVCRGKDTDAFYQILALKAHFTRSAWLHVGYQLSRFKDPNNLMIGIGYTFNNRR